MQQILNGFMICYQIFEVWTWIWIWFLDLVYGSNLVRRYKFRLDSDHKIIDIVVLGLDLGFGIGDMFGIWDLDLGFVFNLT